MIKKNKAAWSISLWDYAVKTYAFDVVKQNCLKLQDEYHANVDIILWCCWLNAENICLPQSVMDEALISLDTVSQSTLLKLRSVRRSVESTGAFTQEQAKVINKQVLKAELMIEKILIYRLQDLTRKSLNVSSSSAEEDPLSLEYYFELLNINGGRECALDFRRQCHLQLVKAEPSSPAN